MGQFDMQNGPSLSDLMNQKAAQQAQLGAMGQESQLRQLQMQGAQQDMAQKQQGYADTGRLRDLMISASQSPGGVEALLPQLLSGGAGIPGLELGMKLKQLTQKEAYTLKPGESRYAGDNRLINQNEKPDKFDPNKPFQMVNGEIVPNEAYQAYEKSKAKAGAPNMTAINNIKSFEPFQNKVQGNMGEALVKNFETLQNIPQTLQALDAAKVNLSNAGNFVGSGADTKLAVAKFFNNNLGTSIDPSGVKNTEALQSALFYNVMDNLKKMDASPSQQQQKVMQDAFGRITTDPAALPMIIDFYKGQVISKAREHNRRVDQTTAGPSGMKFPYDIHVNVPDSISPPASNNTAIPKSANSLPNPSTLPNGAIITDTVSGRKLIVNNGKYQPAR